MGAGLRLSDVVKAYPGVVALRGVDFDVQYGEIHGLVGENGAGKSTLMGIASGAVAATSGTVEVAGVALRDPDPNETLRLGLAIVHQRPALLPDLTVRENMLLGLPEDRRPGRDEVDGWIRATAEEWGEALAPEQRAGALPMRAQFVVEIARALAARPKVLLLDEPTEHLDAEGVDRLFPRLRALRDAGTALVYISHRIREVSEITDRVTILRDGETQGTFPTAEVSESEIIRLVVGRTLDTVFPDKAGQTGAAPPALAVAGYRAGGIHDLSLDVRAGEIVGLAGIEGSGQDDLVRGLAGLLPSAGRVEVDGRPVALGRSERARRAGIVFLAADRHAEGVVLDLSVQHNATLSALDRFTSAGLVDRGGERRAAGAVTERLQLKAPSLDAPVRTLSGGNQQKVALSRVALSEPRVILADHPTQGVDAGARIEIYDILRDLASSGCAVLVNSSDALELAGLCDRVLVLSRGQPVAELSGDGLTEQAITTAVLTSTTRRHGSSAAGTPGRRRALLDRDGAPSVLLLGVMLLLALVAGLANDSYLTARNLDGYLTLLTPLLLVALAQQLVLLLGLIDLSLGPLTGFLVVVASFLVTEDAGPGGLAAGLSLMALAALAVGVLHWLLVQRVGLNAVVATLLTFTGLQGLSLLLRPVPGGALSEGVTDAVEAGLGPVPYAFVLAVLLGIGLEVASRRTLVGIRLRAAGSDADVAAVLGIDRARLTLLAFVGCSLLGLLAGVMLMAQVGIGAPGSGTGFTLSSIGAVVLGGASIFGGRGSFVGALFGAALIQQIVNAMVFLRLGSAWELALVGGLTLLAATLFSRGRAARAAAA